jgi:ATP-binding cassette subfamily B protein
MRNLCEVISGTVILITHRVSSIQDFDNIIVLEQGQVAEQGTHEQLMSNKAAYYNLVQDQHT